MGDIRECGEFERAGNGKTGPNTFSVVQDRQATKPAAFEFAEPGLARKDGPLYARGRGNGLPRLEDGWGWPYQTGAKVEEEMGALATPYPQRTEPGMNSLPATPNPMPPTVESQEDCAALQKTQPDKNGVMANQDTNDAAFILIEPDLAGKRHGNHIYARIRLAGQCIWESTQPDDPELARKWKKKWEEKQWLQKQGYIAKEPESAGTPAAAKNENGGASETKPEPSSLNVNEILNNYVAAGHHTTIIPALSGRSGPHGAAGIDFTRETGILRRKF